MKNNTTISIDLTKEIFQIAVFHRAKKAIKQRSESKTNVLDYCAISRCINMHGSLWFGTLLG